MSSAAPVRPSLMLIIAGQLRVAPSDRDTVVALSRPAVEVARSTAGCLDFVVAADVLDHERVNVYERWADRGALEAFRGDGPDDALRALIISAEITEFEARATEASD